MDARGSVLSTSADRFRFPGFGVGGQGQPPSEAPHRRPKTARRSEIDGFQWRLRRCQRGSSRPNSTENCRDVCRRENRKEAKSIDSSGDCVVVKEVSAGQTALKTGEMRAGEEAGGTAKSIDTSRDYVVGK